MLLLCNSYINGICTDCGTASGVWSVLLYSASAYIWTCDIFATVCVRSGATPAALVGGTLATLGIVSGSEEAKAVVPSITLVAALWLLLFFFIKAGRIVNYISTPVMGGFISGIGVTIILMQTAKLFGGNAGTGEAIQLVMHIAGEFGSFNLLSAVLGVGTLGLFLLRRSSFQNFQVSASYGTWCTCNCNFSY